MALDISRLKIYVAPLLLIAGALAVLIVVIMPTLTQIAATREELTVLDDRRAKLAVKAGILGTVTEPGLRSDIAVAEISLPTDDFWLGDNGSIGRGNTDRIFDRSW